MTTKATDRKKAKAIADALEKTVRTKRTLRQAQVALDRLHEEISGHKISRKSLRDFANDWLEIKAPGNHTYVSAGVQCLAEIAAGRDRNRSR